MRFILRHCGFFRGHVPIPLGLGTPCGKVSPHVPDASFLRIRAPCLRPFYEAVPFFRLLRLFTRSSKMDFPVSASGGRGFRDRRLHESDRPGHKALINPRAAPDIGMIHFQPRALRGSGRQPVAALVLPVSGMAVHPDEPDPVFIAQIEQL